MHFLTCPSSSTLLTVSPVSQVFSFCVWVKKTTTRLSLSIISSLHIMPRKEFEDALDKYGNYEIEKLRVVRRPLFGNLTEFAQKFAEQKGVPVHDKYFHLWTEFALKDPLTGAKTVLLTEKNQTLNAVEDRSGGLDDAYLGLGQQGMNVDLPDPNVHKIKLGEYFGASKAFHEENGESFYRYTIKYGNCQHHTINSLNANGLLTPEIEAFANQSAEVIVPTWASFVGNVFSDALALRDTVVEKVHGVVDKFRHGTKPHDVMTRMREESFLLSGRQANVSPLPIAPS